MRPNIDDMSNGAKGSIGTAAGGAVTEATVGLDTAWQSAKGALSGIFGDTPPWEMSPGEIVDIVGGGGGEAAGVLLANLSGLIGVVPV